MKEESNITPQFRLINLPNLFTGLNLLSGVVAIVLTTAGRLDLAVLSILIGMFFDFLDGMAARLLKVQSELGKQLDSLADMVTFGVAPGFIMIVMMIVDVDLFTSKPYPEYIYFDFTEHISLLLSGEINDFVPFLALFIPFFSMLRLGKFNLDARQSVDFIGLPTPANTLFFLTFPVLLYFPEMVPEGLEGLREVLLDQYVMAILCVAFSLLLISELPLFSLKFKNLTWKANNIRFIFLLISIGLIFVFKVLALPLIVILYLILSIVKHFLLNRNEV